MMDEALRIARAIPSYSALGYSLAGISRGYVRQGNKDASMAVLREAMQSASSLRAENDIVLVELLNSILSIAIDNATFSIISKRNQKSLSLAEAP